MLIRTLVDGFKNPKMPVNRKLYVILSLVYFVFPIDIIPDIIPVLGYTDDFGLVGFTLWKFYKEAKQLEAVEQVTPVVTQITTQDKEKE